MIKEATATGATIDEAKEAAILLLSADDDADIQFEIIDLPQKKTFGLFGGCPAKVRAFYEDGRPDPATVQKTELSADKTMTQKAKQPEPIPMEKNTARKEENKPSVTNSVKQTKPEKRESEESIQDKKVTDEQRDIASKAATEYLSKILPLMGVDAKLEVSPIETGIEILISGEHLGHIVGRRGETLDALQYLTVLAANRKELGYCRITLDTGNYREKREKTLQGLAKRMAGQALKTGRNSALEPMNPYERRIIHTTIQEIDGVNSWSVGEEPNRRVIIGVSRENAGRYRDDRRPRRNNRDLRSARRDTSPAVAQREVKKDLDNAPLYGRIDQQ